MPYIDRHVRKRLDEHIEKLAEEMSAPGDLSYIISRLATVFGTTHFQYTTAGYYTNLATIYGVLTATAEEFRRRVLDPYEDRKRMNNGDVYQELLHHLAANAHTTSR